MGESRINGKTFDANITFAIFCNLRHKSGFITLWQMIYFQIPTFYNLYAVHKQSLNYCTRFGLEFCVLLILILSYYIILPVFKVYYWITLPQKSISPIYNRDEPIERSSLVHIRSCILQIVEKLIFTNASDTNDNETNRDEEFQILFDYIAIVNEDDNLLVWLLFSLQSFNHLDMMC